MPRPLSDAQVSQYVSDLEQDTGSHESILCGCDSLCLDKLSPYEIKEVARKCASQIHTYIYKNQLPHDAFRQLQEAQDNWALAKVTARRVNKADDE